MTLEVWFSLASALVLPGWAALLLAPGWRFGREVLAPFVIPGLLGLLYLGLAVGSFGEGDGGFGSLAEVRRLFARDEALLAGWVHYLAFDLVVGAWETRDAVARGVRHALRVPCLLLTFLLGPIGYLLWLGARTTGRAAA